MNIKNMTSTNKTRVDKENKKASEDSNEITNISDQENSKYKKLDEIINFKSGKSESFTETFLSKIRGISTFIKKIKLEDDPTYFESRNKDYAKLMRKSKDKIENMIKKLMFIFGGKKPNMEDFDTKNFDSISDYVDDLMEKVSDNIDILKGKKKDKREAEIEEELKNIQALQASKYTKKTQDNQGLKNKLELPMEADEFDIDNSYYPFIPKIKSKPHAITPLSLDITHARQLRNKNLEKFKSIKFEDRKENREMKLFEHPYKEEVVDFMNKLAKNFDEFKSFFSEYSKMDNSININKRQGEDLINFEKIQLSDLIPRNVSTLDMAVDDIKQVVEIIKQKNLNNFHRYFILNEFIDKHSLQNLLTQYEIEYLPLNQTRFVYVGTHDELQTMISDIESYADEISVDLEHHSQESYLGLTCLMQISTRFADYVIDTIKLRCFMQEINQIFCNPKIVKVLHGADFDVEWLQKDFGVHIVNMFDTGQAARMLQLPSFSLANLLGSVCNIIADKKYQLADWRMRPLPAEMIKYAREDTHYLLYIYDHLRKKLIERSLQKNEDICMSILKVCKKSNELTLKQYAKPVLKGEDYYKILSRNCTHNNKRQLSILKIIYKFRDFVARKLDLSPHMVLPYRNLFNLVKLPKLDLDTVYMNLDKSAKIRNFVPELVKIIEQKLIRNENKINQGSGTKLLEKSYIDNIKSKLETSKEIVGALVGSKTGVVKKENDLNLSLKIKKVSLNKITENPLNLGEIKAKGNDVRFKSKSGSKFNPPVQNIDVNIDMTDTDTSDEYNSLIKRFDNFNILSYLQDKYPSLKIQVEKKQVKSENKPVIKQNVQMKTAESKAEIFLKQKRKGPELEEHMKNMLDLTDHQRPVNGGFKKKKVTFADDEEKSSEDNESISNSDISVAENNMLNPNAEANAYARAGLSQQAKNMIASENFIKNLMKSNTLKKK